MIKRINTVLRTRGLEALFRIAYCRAFHSRLASFQNCGPMFRGKAGLEIGGPSGVFGRRGLFPVYPLARRIDNCNFGSTTVWEGTIEQGLTFRYDGQHNPGTQYVAEATDLGFIASNSYDFVLSSHTLEHVANPLAALTEWKRVLKDDGVLALVLPHREGTFDHRRPVTKMSHLIDDLERKTGEDDQTHLEEILALHDLAMDPEAGGSDAFKARAMRNIESRCLHQHVFDSQLAIDMVDHMGFQIMVVETHQPFHIFVIARKPGVEARVRNESFVGMTPRDSSAESRSFRCSRSICGPLIR